MRCRISSQKASAVSMRASGERARNSFTGAMIARAVSAMAPSEAGRRARYAFLEETERLVQENPEAVIAKLEEIQQIFVQHAQAAIDAAA